MKIVKMGFPVILFSLAIIITAYTQVTIPPDKDQLLKGEASGQAFVAEKNGFPPLQKIIALKDQLGLTKEQMKKINEMATNLSISAAVKGQEIVEAEEDLNKLFESGTVNDKTLRMKLEQIGKMRADLRLVHLQVYLKEKQILSTKQWERLKELQASEVK
jgi:Spy/CpxP family protein refolding chaperone